MRPIRDDDWDGIAALETQAYAPYGLSEGRAVLESRGRASPSTCFVLDLDRRVAGYLLALPYPLLLCPDLSRPEQRAFRSPNLHLHDLVIAEDRRGRGLAQRLLSGLTVTAEAQRYEQISLVAVGRSETFWSASGFRIRPEVDPPQQYGTGAVYMSLALPTAPPADPDRPATPSHISPTPETG